MKFYFSDQQHLDVCNVSSLPNTDCCTWMTSHDYPLNLKGIIQCPTGINLTQYPDNADEIKVYDIQMEIFSNL